MKNKLISLHDMVKLSHNAELSEPYIRYLCGIDSEHQYRHQEIVDIASFLNGIPICEDKLSGFIYSYVVPQLNKEFDLLKITENTCLNIELKSSGVALEKIERQLLQNRHYLKLLNKPELLTFTYISNTNSAFTLDNQDNVVQCPVSELVSVMNAVESEAVSLDLDSVFTPKNILVSPLNSTERFLRGDYLLTENQETIKKDILQYVQGNISDRFVGLTGGPGTGKTLLIYDIARELARSQRVLIVHSGILCDGHRELDTQLNNIRIISAKALRLREIRDVDIVIVDEAHRLYTDTLDKVDRWVKRAKTTCIFSYDAGQMLSYAERRRKSSETIDQLCAGHVYKLTNKIRTNKELALFITCLRDLSKFRDEYSFPNVRIIYEPDKQRAISQAKALEDFGYTYISYTPSLYNPGLDDQISIHNTHNVIGQEFESVCMLLDDNFYYDESGHLSGVIHPNPDYLFAQLLYQGLSRVRSRIALIVVSEKILVKILPLLKNS